MPAGNQFGYRTFFTADRENFNNIRQELSPSDAEAFARIFGDIDAAKKANVERFDQA